MKKVICVLTTLLLLAGCTTFASADEDITLEMMLHKNEIVDIMQTMADLFHEDYPNITVVVNQPSDYDIVLQSRFLANTPPDIFTWSNQLTYYEYFKEGYCADLTDVAWIQESISPKGLESISLDGSVYAVPYMQNAYGVFYNADMFEEYGLDIPVTFDEFWTVCEALKDAGVTPIVLTDADAWTAFNIVETLLGLYCEGQGEPLFEGIAEGTASATEDEEIRKVAEIYVKLSEYSQADTLSTSYTDGISAVANGEAAMMINGTWANTLIKAAGDANISCFPLPCETAGETAIRTNVDLSFSICEDAGHIEESMLFVQWMVENAQTFTNLEGSVSLVQGVENATPAFDMYAQYTNEGKTFSLPRLAWKVGLNTMLQPLTITLRETGDVDAFLTEVDSEVDMLYND